MTTHPFTGIWPALLTPLDAALNIDTARLAAHARGLLAAGCGGVTPFGTTGEFASFSAAERIAGLDALLAAGVPAARVIVHTSAAALPDVVALTRHALAVGAHGCLMLPPFYFKGVGDEGVCNAFRQVIDAVADDRLRMYLYHIPQLSGVPITPGVIEALKREYPGMIVGIKDSECRLEHSLALAAAFMHEVRVYVGNELDLRELGRRGSTGAISGIANFMPRTVHAMVSQPDTLAAAAGHERVARLLGGVSGHALIPTLKGVMAALGGDAGWLRVRAPLVALDPGAAAQVAALARALALDASRD